MLTKEIRGHTAWLKIDRPDKLNAMPRDFWAELPAAFDELAAEEAVRVVVIHGEGRSFSVGGDIEDFGNIGGVEDRRAYLKEAFAAFQAVENSSLPVIAAVHGHALGGGCELSMVSDIVIADETARFGLPEAAVGLVPGIGVVRGRAQTNVHWLKYLIMTGLPITAEEALRAGLVNRVVPKGEHLVEAERLADAIGKRSPLALAVGKQLIGRDSWDGYSYAVEAIALLQGADDFAEGIAAFTEGREPDFS